MDSTTAMMAGTGDSLFKAAPWDRLLAFKDPILEKEYWNKRVKEVLSPFDRVMCLFGAVGVVAWGFRLKELGYISFLLCAFVALLLLGLGTCSSVLGEFYAEWRPLLVVTTKMILVPVMSILKAMVLSVAPPTTHLVSLMVLLSNSSLLMTLTLGLQNKFRTHIILHLLLGIVAMQFCPMYCWFSLGESHMISAISGLARKIDEGLQMLMTMNVSTQGLEYLNRGSACWFALCFLQLSTSLITGSILYALESHSRVVYILSTKRHSVQDRQFLWRAWRHGILMLGWSCLVGLTMIHALLKMIAERLSKP